MCGQIAYQPPACGLSVCAATMRTMSAVFCWLTGTTMLSHMPCCWLMGVHLAACGGNLCGLPQC